MDKFTPELAKKWYIEDPDFVIDILANSTDSIAVSSYLVNLDKAEVYDKTLIELASNSRDRDYLCNKGFFCDVIPFADEYINHARQKLNI